MWSATNIPNQYDLWYVVVISFLFIIKDSGKEKKITLLIQGLIPQGRYFDFMSNINLIVNPKNIYGKIINLKLENTVLHVILFLQLQNVHLCLYWIEIFDNFNCRLIPNFNKIPFQVYQLVVVWHILTYLALDKMAAISQTPHSDAFCWMKTVVFWFEFHWSLFLRVQLTISQHWFR